MRGNHLGRFGPQTRVINHGLLRHELRWCVSALFFIQHLRSQKTPRRLLLQKDVHGLLRGDRRVLAFVTAVGCLQMEACFQLKIC